MELATSRRCVNLQAKAKTDKRNGFLMRGEALAIDIIGLIGSLAGDRRIPRVVSGDLRDTQRWQFLSGCC